MKNKNTSAQRYACKCPQQPYSQQPDTRNNPSNNQLMNDKQDVVGQQSVAQLCNPQNTVGERSQTQTTNATVSFL